MPVVTNLSLKLIRWDKLNSQFIITTILDLYAGGWSVIIIESVVRLYK